MEGVAAVLDPPDDCSVGNPRVVDALSLLVACVHAYGQGDEVIKVFGQVSGQQLIFMLVAHLLTMGAKQNETFFTGG